MTTAPFVGRVVQAGQERRIQPLVETGVRATPCSDAYDVGDIVRVVALSPLRAEVLAEQGSARARLFEILERYEIDPEFSRAVLAETAEWLANPGLDDEMLVDLTTHPFFTIDNEDSLDLDQAMYIAREGRGFALYYALADAAYYVGAHSALLAEALRRGSSYYLPGLCIPMLPTALSEGLVSLNERVDRRALVVCMHLDEAAEVIRTEFLRAKIQSRAKLTYDGVQNYHDAEEGHDFAGQDYTETLDLLRVVGELRIARAERRDVINFDRRYLTIGYDSNDRQRFSVRLEQRNQVEKWNEQISLLCNMEGAALLLKDAPQEGIEPIYRSHPAPLSERLDELVQAIEAIAKSHRLDPAIWHWKRYKSSDQEAETLATYLRRLPQEGDTYRVRAALERQVLYANRASTFGIAAEGHYALGVEGYARFSSPMREIVGIYTHKEALEKLGMVDRVQSAAEDQALRAKVIDAANLGKELQKKLTKEANKLAIDQLLAGDLELDVDGRPWRMATVLGVRPSRLYVELDEFPVDLKVYSCDLEQAHRCEYQQDELGVRLLPSDAAAPRFSVGSGIGVRTLGYDDKRRRWRLSARPVTNTP